MSNLLGVTDERYRFYKKYYPWRVEALERDGFTCKDCGRVPPKVRLHVHHVDGKGMRNSYKNDHVDNSLSNLVTLCSVCHGRRHFLMYQKNINFILEMRSQGLTYREIGEFFNLSRQRIHQILTKDILDKHEG